MKTTGLGLAVMGGLALAFGALAEVSLKNDILLVVDFGVMDHRMLITLVGGFLLVAGVVLYAASAVIAALDRQTAIIQEAINTPDSEPVEQHLPRSSEAEIPVAAMGARKFAAPQK